MSESLMQSELSMCHVISSRAYITWPYVRTYIYTSWAEQNKRKNKRKKKRTKRKKKKKTKKKETFRRYNNG